MRRILVTTGLALCWLSGVAWGQTTRPVVKPDRVPAGGWPWENRLKFDWESGDYWKSQGKLKRAFAFGKVGCLELPEIPRSAYHPEFIPSPAGCHWRVFQVISESEVSVRPCSWYHPTYNYKMDLVEGQAIVLSGINTRGLVSGETIGLERYCFTASSTKTANVSTLLVLEAIDTTELRAMKARLDAKAAAETQAREDRREKRERDTMAQLLVKVSPAQSVGGKPASDYVTVSVMNPSDSRIESVLVAVNRDRGEPVWVKFNIIDPGKTAKKNVKVGAEKRVIARVESIHIPD